MKAGIDNVFMYTTIKPSLKISWFVVNLLGISSYVTEFSCHWTKEKKKEHFFSTAEPKQKWDSAFVMFQSSDPQTKTSLRDGLINAGLFTCQKMLLQCLQMASMSAYTSFFPKRLQWQMQKCINFTENLRKQSLPRKRVTWSWLAQNVTWRQKSDLRVSTCLQWWHKTILHLNCEYWLAVNKKIRKLRATLDV